MNHFNCLIAALLLGPLLSLGGAAQGQPAIRMYVFDAGTLESDPARYQLKPDEVKATQLAMTAFLIVHPRGTLMWDTGGVADDTWTPTGGPVRKRILLSDYRERPVVVRQSLVAQLASAGYQPSLITYLSLSHYHWDHVANANLFAGATWLVRKVEREAMFPERLPEVAQPSTFAALRSSKVKEIDTDEFDVFGDGTVLIVATPGHTPGHQSLYVKLVNTGGVVLAGDLYHYPEERSLNRLPTADVNVNETKLSRERVEAFLSRTRSQLWIQHDLTAAQGWKKAPAYYD
jgi:glyoxylase-like metal-dependent hydrolase (beta-lactamase superfamily II)